MAIVVDNKFFRVELQDNNLLIKLLGSSSGNTEFVQVAKFRFDAGNYSLVDPAMRAVDAVKEYFEKYWNYDDYQKKVRTGELNASRTYTEIIKRAAEESNKHRRNKNQR